MPCPLGVQLPGSPTKLRAGRPGRVVDDRGDGIRAFPGHPPAFQRGDQLVRIGHPQFRQAAQIGTVGLKKQPHPFRYCSIRRRDPVRGGLNLSRPAALFRLRRVDLLFAFRGLVKQLAQLCDRLFLPVGDGLGIAPGSSEHAGGRFLGGL
jgi:hypothetical protein